MPWNTRDTMNLRQEFLSFATKPDRNIRELCRRFNISPPTAYKWLARQSPSGPPDVADRSRRPLHSPTRTPPEIEQLVVALREEHPAWGGRKIERRLTDLEHPRVPAPSTVTSILHRHELISAEKSESSTAWHRFEHERPNELLQMDFKGYVRNERGLCHPLTVIDDCSRFVLGLEACNDEQFQTVQSSLIRIFKRYGLPRRMTMDNGSPWGGDLEGLGYTQLTVWLMMLGIRVSHSRPYHPQTQGKDERFHRTLDVELLQLRRFIDNVDAQHSFDKFRFSYNHERPHEALDLETPSTRYAFSTVPYPQTLPQLEYLDTDRVYKVDKAARITFARRKLKIGKPFIGLRVGLRETRQDGLYSIWFGRIQIGIVDLTVTSNGQVTATRPPPPSNNVSQ